MDEISDLARLTYPPLGKLLRSHMRDKLMSISSEKVLVNVTEPEPGADQGKSSVPSHMPNRSAVGWLVYERPGDRFEPKDFLAYLGCRKDFVFIINIGAISSGQQMIKQIIIYNKVSEVASAVSCIDNLIIICGFGVLCAHWASSTICVVLYRERFEDGREDK